MTVPSKTNDLKASEIAQFDLIRRAVFARSGIFWPGAGEHTIVSGLRRREDHGTDYARPPPTILELPVISEIPDIRRSRVTFIGNRALTCGRRILSAKILP